MRERERLSPIQQENWSPLYICCCLPSYDLGRTNSRSWKRISTSNQLKKCNLRVAHYFRDFISDEREVRSNTRIPSLPLELISKRVRVQPRGEFSERGRERKGNGGGGADTSTVAFHSLGQPGPDIRRWRGPSPTRNVHVSTDQQAPTLMPTLAVYKRSTTYSAVEWSVQGKKRKNNIKKKPN